MAVAAPRQNLSVFFGRERGMAFFLVFLTLATVVMPMFDVSPLGQLALSLIFALALIFGSLAIMRRRIGVYLVVALTVSTFTVDVFAGFRSFRALASIDTILKLVCLSILAFITLKRTLRPGRVTPYQVAGGIAGYLLIGLIWAFAYQLVVQEVPDAIHFEHGTVDVLSQQPSDLIYFSFTTLTTVGYGDVHPVRRAARSLAVAEMLIGQLYLAILISSLVGMALQARVEERPKHWQE
jgi:hypothetical protein